MSDEEGLWAALRADPYDPLLHEALSDLLEEGGRLGLASNHRQLAQHACDWKALGMVCSWCKCFSSLLHDVGLCIMCASPLEVGKLAQVNRKCRRCGGLFWVDLERNYRLHTDYMNRWNATHMEDVHNGWQRDPEDWKRDWDRPSVLKSDGGRVGPRGPRGLMGSPGPRGPDPCPRCHPGGSWLVGERFNDVSWLEGIE